jgi:phytoene dehydrogenase-like protein
MMKSIETRYDVVIAGGGIAGLTAAAYLAKARRHVLVAERAGELGGRAATDASDGFFLNLGAHALYRGGPAKEVLAELGVEVPGHVVPSSGAYGIRGGALHTLPSGAFSLMTTSLLPLTGKLELARLLSRIGELPERIAPGTDLASWTATAAADPSARQLIEALLRLGTYGSDPRTLPAATGLRQLAQALHHGVEYIDGGWGVMVDRIAKIAERAGAKLRTSMKIARVVPGAGVELEDGTKIGARAVIVTAPPKAAAKMFDGLVKNRLEVFAEHARPAVAACFDVGLSRLPRPKAAFALGIDQPLYASVHSRVAALAPAGAALIHGLKYLDPSIDTDPARDEAEIERAFDLLQPGWREVVVKRRFLPRMTVMNAIVPHRFPTSVAEAPGVYFAGDWAGSERLLADASFESARTAARELLAGTQVAEVRAA